MRYVYLVVMGPAEPAAVDAVEACVPERFGHQTRRSAALPHPDYAWDAARGQYSSALLLRQLEDCRPPDALRVLGITEVDLYVPMLTFVFGQAQLGGALALVSLARLRQEFYGLPPDPAVLRARARREAAHELGHTFGLLHCPDPACAMRLSTTLQQLDLKTDHFCAVCVRALARARAAGNLP